MKIIVTERQLEILKLIKENEDVINTFKSRFNAITRQLNSLYSKIQFINVAELINKEIDVKELLDFVNSLELSNDKIESDMTEFFNSEGEAAYVKKFESIHYDIEKNYNYKNSRKINVISAILMNLDKLVDDLESLVNQNVEDKYSPDAFEDININ